MDSIARYFGESWRTATFFVTDVLPLPLQVFMTVVILAAIVPMLVVVCISVASALGLIHLDRSKKEAIPLKADQIPDSGEKTASPLKPQSQHCRSRWQKTS